VFLAFQCALLTSWACRERRLGMFAPERHRRGLAGEGLERAPVHRAKALACVLVPMPVELLE
jgi:hypothetical protein